MLLQGVARRMPGWVVFAALWLALAASFLYAPTEAFMGPPQRIMYFHVAAAWNALLAFTIVFVSSLAYLFGGRPAWDRLAHAAGEVGVFFTTLTLLSGVVWARAVWGAWWTWEPRLTTTLLLWFLYLGYLLLRAAAEGDAARARLSAVYAVAAYLDAPIVYVSVYWWRGLHPTRVVMDPRMTVALYVSAAAFTLFHLYLLGRRLQLEDLREEVQALKESFRS